ncbi:1-deoxy-D-xylulose-5-phosphate reductoisomerase [Nanoarchaeota archaeon]
MKRISILGSTGSIGTQTLDVVEKNQDKFKVVGLTCNSNIALLKQQIEKFSPEAVAIMNEEVADDTILDIPVYKGIEGLKKIATLQNADLVVNSLVGSIGILPTSHAIENDKDIALANKETLVSAGKHIMELANRKGVNIFPVDSEHSGIFQCINGERKEDIKKIILTCSGGPFHNSTSLQDVTREDALNHPTWKMGNKITIDSATLMNKGFEVIEAHWLYGIDYDNIEVVVHPQSIVHSLVEFNDGSLIAQLSDPDMRRPIQYALSYPNRLPHRNTLNLTNLEFKEPNRTLFPSLDMAYIAGKTGGSLPAVLNASNEVAVAKFLKGEIKFTDIFEIIREQIESHEVINDPSIDEILKIDSNIKNEHSNNYSSR